MSRVVASPPFASVTINLRPRVAVAVSKAVQIALAAPGTSRSTGTTKTRRNWMERGSSYHMSRRIL